MASEPLVSVIIASYNHEKYIGPAMLSVLNQTYKNFELLVLDDGSTDKTYQVIQHVATKDKRIKCWRQDNVGVVTSLNNLMREAKGEFIAQLGSDDLWMPQRLAWGLEDMREKPNLSATFCSFLTVDNNLVPIKPVNPLNYHPLQGALLASYLVFNNFLGALTAFIRADCLQHVGPFARQLHTCQDWDLWLRLSMQGDLNLRPHIGALYRRHGDNLSSKKQDLLAKEFLQVLEETSPLVVRHYNMGEEMAHKLTLRTAQFAMSNGRPDRAVELLVNKAEQKPLDDPECLTLLYSLHLAKKHEHARELREILNQRKHELAPHLQSDLAKIATMMTNQIASA